MSSYYEHNDVISNVVSEPSVVKAYTTRVGEGPFATEDTAE